MLTRLQGERELAMQTITTVHCQQEERHRLHTVATASQPVSAVRPQWAEPFSNGGDHFGKQHLFFNMEFLVMWWIYLRFISGRGGGASRTAIFHSVHVVLLRIDLMETQRRRGSGHETGRGILLLKTPKRQVLVMQIRLVALLSLYQNTKRLEVRSCLKIQKSLQMELELEFVSCF